MNTVNFGRLLTFVLLRRLKTGAKMRAILIFVTRQTLLPKVCSHSSYVNRAKMAILSGFWAVFGLPRSFLSVYRDHLLTYMALRRSFEMYDKKGFCSARELA
jgi:hypothetical protein